MVSPSRLLYKGIYGIIHIRWIRVRRSFCFVNYCKLHIGIGLAGGMHYGDLRDDGGWYMSVRSFVLVSYIGPWRTTNNILQNELSSFRLCCWDVFVHVFYKNTRTISMTCTISNDLFQLYNKISMKLNYS